MFFTWPKSLYTKHKAAHMISPRSMARSGPRDDWQQANPNTHRQTRNTATRAVGVRGAEIVRWESAREQRSAEDAIETRSWRFAFVTDYTVDEMNRRFSYKITDGETETLFFVPFIQFRDSAGLLTESD